MVNDYMRFTGNYGACDDEQMKNKTKIPVYTQCALKNTCSLDYLPEMLDIIGTKS